MDESQVSLDQISPELCVQLRMKRSFFRTEWVKVKLYKLNEDECVIKTDEEFLPGEKLVLSIHYALEPVSLEINELQTKVVSKTKLCSCFVYDLSLELSDKSDATPLIGERIRKLNALIAHKRNTTKKSKTS